MQDIQLINAGQLFNNPNPNSVCTGVVLDHRLRQTHLQNQVLKCPRCDSLNTKFCYYNNYNLSQPRHFCKSCKRYWTKGGVLRNVPVGGGCRKSSKRSSAASKLSKSSEVCRSKPKSNNSNSGSESSSLTGTVNDAMKGGDVTAIAAVPSSADATPPFNEAVSNSFGAVFGFGDPKFIFPQIRNTNVGSEIITSAECGGGDVGFWEKGNFSNLNNETTTLKFSSSSYDAVSPYEQYDLPYEHCQLSTEVAAGGCYVNPTVQIDQHQSSTLGSEPFSWDQEQNQPHMFSLASVVDQVYWSQSQQQWSNNDNAHLYSP